MQLIVVTVVQNAVALEGLKKIFQGPFGQPVPFNTFVDGKERSLINFPCKESPRISEVRKV